ncbi:hypothetical protein SLEP1_g41307 [Rubroshorea leprosula]|uniref:Uncharacterized protein n=1 Tax=Rubroshorea leprosula TaxID=152421 RepID=A0AAV5L6E8_9ROSI|nr:hypothetical protein SLEP1_g41307 [Rubroshorea leprosula]
MDTTATNADGEEIEVIVPHWLGDIFRLDTTDKMLAALMLMVVRTRDRSEGTVGEKL